MKRLLLLGALAVATHFQRNRKPENLSQRHLNVPSTWPEVLELIRLLPETWANVIKVCRVFGIRSWEVAFIARATNDDGEPQLRVTKGKTYNTRGGVKEETDPRWLEAVAVDGSTFGLVESWDQLKLPPPCPGRPSGPSCAVCPTGSS